MLRREVYRRFRGACCLHHHRPDDGGSKYLWNVGKLLPDYTAQHPRRHIQKWFCPCRESNVTEI
jgi:hypothetical protein